MIHVSFTLSPEIRRLPIHDPDTLSVEDFYYRYHFDPEALYAPLNMREVEILQTVQRGLTYIEPGATRTLEVECSEGFWAAHDLLSGFGFAIQLADAPVTVPQHFRVTLTDRGWQGQPEAVAPGPVRLELHNATSRRGSLSLLNIPPTYNPEPLRFPPVLSGNKLLSSQTFRTLFRSEVIQSAEGIGVRDLTLLFTDLKGSTALYEHIGDLRAFALVQRHFDYLGRAVRANNGAIVKTIGDAVMACFETPTDAVRAALAMLTEIEAFNQEEGGQEIILKIGIHRGPSIAVTLNDRLDYFGQTVNTAARVQGLADAEEICLTREVYGYTGVPELFAGLTANQEMDTLKGIEKPMLVYRVTRN